MWKAVHHHLCGSTHTDTDTQLWLAAQMLQAEFARLARSEELARAAPPAKAAADREAWRGWLRRYRARLQQEADAGASTHARIDAMNGINPRSGRAHAILKLSDYLCDILLPD